MVDPGMLELALDMPEDVHDTGDETVLSAFTRPKRSLYDLTVLERDLVEAAANHFHTCDADDDGLLTASELEEVFGLLKLSENDALKEVLTEMVGVSVSNGIVDFDEFLTIVRMVVASRDPTDEETRFRKAFRSFDEDGNGFLDVSELQQVLSTIGNQYSEEEVKKMFHEMDTDGDGQVDYSEFVAFLGSQQKGLNKDEDGK